MRQHTPGGPKSRFVTSPNGFTTHVDNLSTRDLVKVMQSNSKSALLDFGCGYYDDDGVDLIEKDAVCE